MTAIFCVHLFELIALGLLLLNFYRKQKNFSKELHIVSILCFFNIFVSLSGFINLRDYGQSSFLYRLVSFGYGVSCILTDFILVVSAQYLLKTVRLRTKMTNIAFYFFWAFCIADAAVFLSNGITHFAYAGTIAGDFQDVTVPLLFHHVSGSWMTCHQYFNLTMVLLIFIAMVLKCASVPILYSGKYITIGLYFLFASLSNFLLEILSLPLFVLHIVNAFISAIPFVLYYQAYLYRPRFLLGSIRQMVFDRLGTPVVLFDNEGLLADFNHDAAKLFVLEKPLINHLDISGFLTRAVGNQMRERSTSTVEEVTVKSSSGQNMIYKLDYTKLKDKYNKNLGTLLLFHDISELKQLYNSMEKTAMTDMLTGLSSKILLQKKITEINLYRKFPYTAVVCSINGINLISEGFGEDAGKAATMHVADLLRSQLRASDFAAYDDGNMIVLMPDTSYEDALSVFKRISRILNHDRTFNFSLSFEYGIASRTSPDSDMQLTVSQAQADMVRNKMKKDAEVHQSIVDSLRDALRLSSFETEQHSMRVQSLAAALAQKLKLPEEDLENLKNLALFHDIGKMSVPAEIMNKPSSLTEEEKHIMQLHVINGYKIANASKELSPISRGILCHHERWDGKGYPNGYSGEQIPYLSRIVSVADTFDVITHDRPYKVALSTEDAVEEIKQNSGKQFDPSIVSAFLSLENKTKFI